MQSPFVVEVTTFVEAIVSFDAERDLRYWCGFIVMKMVNLNDKLKWKCYPLVRWQPK